MREAAQASASGPRSAACFFESAVDSRSGAGEHVYSFDFDGVDRANPYGRTLGVARQAHRFYGTLVREYDRHGYDARVNAISQRQLNRAANAVADLIAEIA